MTDGKLDNILQLHTYIKENVNADGTIYILGGESAVPASVEMISGYHICRLQGASRYDTNIAILNEAGIDGEELIVATGKTFADSLSASAAKLPILLVKPNASLTQEQKEILREVSGGTIYIIGGEGAVNAKIEKELEKYGPVERIFGATRYETSVKAAETFFEEVHEIVLASGKNFPDGLCGGALASAMDAPLILTTDGKTYDAAGYLQKEEVTSGYVLGGSGALSDESVVDVFKLVSADDIIQK